MCFVVLITNFILLSLLEWHEKLSSSSSLEQNPFLHLLFMRVGSEIYYNTFLLHFPSLTFISRGNKRTIVTYISLKHSFHLYHDISWGEDRFQKAMICCTLILKVTITFTAFKLLLFIHFQFNSSLKFSAQFYVTEGKLQVTWMNKNIIFINSSILLLMLNKRNLYRKQVLKFQNSGQIF